MISERQLFLDHLAQTSDTPLMLEIDKAEGLYLFDKEGNKYLDLISGISVSNLGHCHPTVIEAVKKQLDRYMHLMVYGEYVQTPQVQFATLLVDQLPASLSSVYFVNSGSEANEGAVKLAKRYTGRYEVIAFSGAYHGSTQGALSLMGNEHFKNAFRPLLPGVKIFPFNKDDVISAINPNTASVIIEPFQGEGGIRIPDISFLKALREKCDQTGALLIFDEAQTGLGRTGKMFAFEQFNIVPDILTLAKSMGGGMPLGAFIASKEIMASLKSSPVLGHITTFGGHPVSCAAAYSSLKTIIDEHLIEQVPEKADIFRQKLVHSSILEVRGMGLFIAVELGDPEKVQKVIRSAMKKGLIIDWFLSCDTAIRIAPPLIISKEEIEEACHLLIQAIEEVSPES